MRGAKRKSPGSATNTTEAQHKKLHSQITTEIVGTVMTGALFAVVVWASVIGMSGGFTSEAGLMLAGVETDAH